MVSSICLKIVLLNVKSFLLVMTCFWGSMANKQQILRNKDECPCACRIAGMLHLPTRESLSQCPTGFSPCAPFKMNSTECCFAPDGPDPQLEKTLLIPLGGMEGCQHILAENLLQYTLFTFEDLRTYTSNKVLFDTSLFARLPCLSPS